MVFQYRVTPDDSPFKNLRFPSTSDENNAVFVDLNSSVILFVTSWASSLAPMLSGFLMALASFPIARQLSNNIRNGRTDSLPTPYQLGLTIRFLDGSALGAIWSWMIYVVSWRKTRVPQTPLLVTTSNIAVLATVLGLLVSAADTWLHLVTTTVPFTQLSPVSSTMNYSFGITPRCLTSNNSVAAQGDAASDGLFCSISIAATGAFFRDPTITYQVISNISSEAAVYTHTKSDGKVYTYFGIPSEELDPNHDFTAHSYASETSCSLTTQPCHVRNAASSVRFNCSAAFAGFINNRDLQSAFYTDEKMNDVTNTYNKGTGNPYYFSFASAESTGVSTVPGGSENKDFVMSLHGALTFALGCKSTVYDVEYDQVNGSITRFNTRISNTSVSNIWQTTVANYPGDWDLPVKQAMTAAFYSTNSSQEFADMVALSYGKSSMAFGAQGIEPRPALAVQRRNTTLVARLPVAPLIAVVAFCLLFVVAGLLLTGLAIWAARFEDVRNIQASLGIVGLVADRFEKDDLKKEAKDTDGFFAEYVGHSGRRVAIEKYTETDSTYRYTTWQSAGISDFGNKPPSR
ncbi:hypothetical protein N7509_003107 [Penicillium cosmopolitanum]|uniref:Uncharacterized protein n=1 Tax=Penicillium cosmopolitanum TaxID=1131564 RepID=A0A9W9W4P5_9EURO|nr:uncharacterized protein N7509_003107 [Penicillium cosmopolitanum]KAJ5403236.1 hypothetical protein N7509_003107 [Penicillium cosmopolitanum]